MDPLTRKCKHRCFSGIKDELETDLRSVRQIFLSALHLSEFDRYILSHNYIKIFNWVRSPFEVPVLHVHCEADCIAEQLIELQSR